MDGAAEVELQEFDPRGDVHLRELFGCEVGLSDHTMGVGVAVAVPGLVSEAVTLLENADAELAFKTKNWLASGGIYYQATKSLKAVAEFNYAVTGDDDDLTDDNKSVAPAVGLMLFF